VKRAPTHYQAPDQLQARFNRETGDALAHVLSRAGVDYDLLTVDVGTSATQVPHRLGRQWVGWHVVDTQTAATFHRSALPSGSAATDLYIQASSAAADTKILVF
jgi:hypothetical protein